MAPFTESEMESVGSVVACAKCNGLGVTGWGPAAEACEECGSVGYVSIGESHGNEKEIKRMEDFDELFGQ